MPDITSGLGPLWGPDFIEVVANDETGMQYTLQVYPDANNPALKAAGLPQQFYFQPQRVYLAKKQNAPADYDFGMTVFKGLMTQETTIGITDAETTDGSVETGGGFCSFSTTFGIPDSVIANAITKLKSGDHSTPAPRIANLIGFADHEPTPRLGMVPVTQNTVVLAVPDLVKASDGSKAPMYISGQTTGKGSVEEHGYSSFLVTCNELAAGAIAGSLQNGVSPFTITNELKESFYISAVKVTVTVDADKVYDSFSAAVSAGGLFGIGDLEASAAYSNCLSNGAIITEMSENGAVLDDKLKDWIQKNVDDMRTFAMNLVKSEIFDWDPSKNDTPATANRGFFSSLFGGSTVSLKANYQHKHTTATQELDLNETIAVDQAVSGDLNDLSKAVKEHPEKYLAIVDIGQYFQKIQIAATCAINFSEALPDGTVLTDPIVSAQIEAGYPDYNNPLDAQGKPNVRVLGEGFHYTIGAKDPAGQVQPAQWTKFNPQDIVNISWLRLDKDVPGWPTDQVWLKRRLVFDGDDPRVNISPEACVKGSEGLVVEFVEPATTDHVPVLTAAQVGYVFTRFALNHRLPKSNITVTIKPTINGDAYPPVVVTQANQDNALWEVYSDKYLQTTSFEYTVAVSIQGPNFTDDPIEYASTAPVKVDIPAGRIKYLNPLPVSLPEPPQDKIAVINSYIANTPA
jgi:hypothetical protein